LKLIW